MPRLRTAVPKLNKHATGQAFIKVGGQQVYLGRYGDPLTQEKYDRTVAVWLANGRRLPVADPADDCQTITVSMMLADYLKSIEGRYGHSDTEAIKSVVAVMRRLYGSSPAADFGPNNLRACRAEMKRKGWCRTYINKQCRRLRAIFRWAVSHELAPEGVIAKLASVEPLKRGEARDNAPVKPVDRSDIRRVRRLVPRQVRALLDLQLLTGARADELVRLRPIDIITKGEVWTATLTEHKTAHHGKTRVLYFGPRAQKVLAEFMRPNRPTTAYLFSPREAFAESKQKDAKGSRRPNQKPNPRKSKRTIGNCYTTSSYRQTIHRACRAVGIKTWGPHRLRHNAATMLRRQYGIEAAQVILGHAMGSAITEVYAEANHEKAKNIIRKIG